VAAGAAGTIVEGESSTIPRGVMMSTCPVPVEDITAEVTTREEDIRRRTDGGVEAAATLLLHPLSITLQGLVISLPGARLRPVKWAIRVRPSMHTAPAKAAAMEVLVSTKAVMADTTTPKESHPHRPTIPSARTHTTALPAITRVAGTPTTVTAVTEAIRHSLARRRPKLRCTITLEAPHPLFLPLPAPGLPP